MDRVTTGARLRQIMNERGLKQIDIVRLCEPYAKEEGLSMGRSAINQYVRDKVLPAQRQLTVLSRALNVSEAWLMGYDVERERNASHVHSDSPVITLSPHEILLVEAYRANPSMQPAINRLLNIPNEVKNDS